MQAIHYDLHSLAKSLKLASVDMIRTPKSEIESHWYRSDGPADLFYWVRGGRLVKHQLNLYGQIVEWNEYDGIKTGYVQEENFQDGDDVTEMVCFDRQPNPFVTQKAVEFLDQAQAIDKVTRDAIEVHYRSFFRWDRLPGTGVFRWLLKKFSKAS